jgi:hypothetical protein
MEKYNWRNRLIIASFGYTGDLSQGQLTVTAQADLKTQVFIPVKV